MADAALSPVRRLMGGIAAAVVGVAVGAALGSGLQSAGRGVWLGDLPSPGVVTVLLALAGLLAGTFALRSALALRLLAGLALAGAAGLAFTMFGAGPGLAFAAGPVMLWARRWDRAAHTRENVELAFGSGLCAFGVALFALRDFWRPADPRVALLIPAALLIVGAVAVLFVHPRSVRPTAARFDLRAALALAGLVLVGFALAFASAQAVSYASYTTSAPNGQKLFAVFGLAGFAFGQFTRPVIRLLVALVALVLGFAAAVAGGRFGPAVLVAAGIGGFGAVLPCLRRADRVHEALGSATILLATMLGMPLAAGIVRGFTRPLLGAVPGIGAQGAGAATATSWGFVLGFYALLALVVLLAHLAHAYEFGFAALDPDDDRDPLPILRKGFAGPKRRS